MSTMRIATYNLWNEPQSWDSRLDAICEEVSRLNADVLALQEVPSRVTKTDSRDIAAYLAERCSYPYFVFQAYPDDPDEGLAFLSKFPLASIECGWDTGISALRSCGLRVQVTANEIPIAITNVHLDWQSILTRERQIVGIAEWIASHADEDGFEVLCGDFNSSPNSSVHRFLTGLQTLAGKETPPWHDLHECYSNRTGYLALPTLDFAGNPRWAEVSTLSPPARVDWIMLQDRDPDSRLTLQFASLFGCEPTPVVGSVPSDHYGVLVDFGTH